MYTNQRTRHLGTWKLFSKVFLVPAHFIYAFGHFRQGLHLFVVLYTPGGEIVV